MQVIATVTLAALKKRAKAFRRAKPGMTHARALEKAAREAGYDNYHDAQLALKPPPHSSATLRPFPAPVLWHAPRPVGIRIETSAAYGTPDWEAEMSARGDQLSVLAQTFIDQAVGRVTEIHEMPDEHGAPMTLDPPLKVRVLRGRVVRDGVDYIDTNLDVAALEARDGIKAGEICFIDGPTWHVGGYVLSEHLVHADEVFPAQAGPLAAEAAIRLVRGHLEYYGLLHGGEEPVNHGWARAGKRPAAGCWIAPTAGGKLVWQVEIWAENLLNWARGPEEPERLHGRIAAAFAKVGIEATRVRMTGYHAASPEESRARGEAQLAYKVRYAATTAHPSWLEPAPARC